MSVADPTLAATGPRQDARLAIGWALLAMFLFICLDSTAKALTAHMPSGQVVWARYTFHALILVVLLRGGLVPRLRTARWRMHLFRSALLTAMTLLYFSALAFIPLADATAILFLTPILVTALSVPVLGEKVGPRRWASVVVAFVGALIIVRPGTGTMELAAVLALGAALVNAGFHLTTRLLGATEDTLTTLLYPALVGTVLSTLFLPLVWTPVPLPVWGLMALLGAIGAASQYCLIKALTHASPVTIAPFNYTTLIWATLLGFVLFGELPDGWTVLGAVLIVGAGLFIYWRERVLARGEAPTP